MLVWLWPLEDIARASEMRPILSAVVRGVFGERMEVARRFRRFELYDTR